MPSNPRGRAALPEFLRSPAVGAVIAEKLDESDDGPPTALGQMIRAAAREIREFHNLPLPAHQHRTAPRLVTDEPERDMDEWTRTEPEADQG